MIVDYCRTALRFIGSKKFTLGDDTVTITTSTDGKTLTVTTTANSYLSDLPGQCGMAVWNNLPGSEELKACDQTIRAVAHRLGYTKLLCTVTGQLQRNVLCESGWVVVDEFVNKRTGSLVWVLTRPVSMEGEEHESLVEILREEGEF